MPQKTPVGEKILSLRKALKLTQGSLAEKVGVSRAAISQFELGETVPSSATLSKLSEALGYDLSEVWQSSSRPDENNDEYISLPYLSIASYPTLLAFGDEKLDNVHNFTLSSTPVLRVPGIDYSEASVIEIRGDSMAPRYPHGSRYVEFPAEIDMKFATGVHLFVFNHETVMVRRIISNKGGTLTLRADATGEELTVGIEELSRMRKAGTCHMVKLGQGVFMPVED